MKVIFSYPKNEHNTINNVLYELIKVASTFYVASLHINDAMIQSSLYY